MANTMYFREHMSAAQAQLAMDTGQYPTQARGRCMPRFYSAWRKKADGELHEVEMVELRIPGDTKSAPVHKVTDALRDAYRPEYEAWKKAEEIPENGTPLEAWMGQDGRVELLRAHNVRTVEQLAEVSDNALSNMGMGFRTLRNQAEAYVKTRENSREAEKYAAENERLLARIQQLEGQVNALSSQEQVSAEEEGAEPKRRPGRPRKSAD